jgi:hypothetical protein
MLQVTHLYENTRDETYMNTSLIVEHFDREIRPLVTDEPVEVQDFRRITDHFRGIYGIYLKLMQKTRRMSTCNQPAGLANTRISTDSAQNLPDRWSSMHIFHVSVRVLCVRDSLSYCHAKRYVTNMTMMIRFVALLWVILTLLQTISIVGSAHELSFN